MRAKRVFLSLHCLFEFYAGITGATFILFLYNKNLDTMETNLIVATSLIITFLMEIPAGALSDFLGYRKTTILSGILLCVTNVLFLIGNSLGIFFLAQIVLGLSCAFESGTLDAWIIKYTSKKECEQIFVKKNKYISTMMIVAGLAGGIVADWMMEGIFLAALAASVLYTVTASVFMQEEEEIRMKERSMKNAADGLKRIISVSVRYCVKDRNIRRIILFNSVLVFCLSPVFVFWSPILHGFERINYTLIALAWIFMRFSMLAGNMLVERICTRSVRAMAAASVVCGVSIIVLAFQNTFLLIFAGILVFEFLLGIIYPLRETALNREIANENRATVLSFHSMVVCIFNYVSMIVMGKLALIFSIRATWILSGVVLCASAAVLFLTEGGKKNVRETFSKSACDQYQYYRDLTDPFAGSRCGSGKRLLLYERRGDIL